MKGGARCAFGHPGAARSGSFCATNRGIVVPCHRVVGADGLGGYGSLGLDYKRRLLALEGVAISEDVRNELAQITQARRCDALAEISALFHTAGLHLRGHGSSRFTSTSPHRRLRAVPSLLRSLDVEARSGRTDSARSAGSRATSCTSWEVRQPWRCCAKPASWAVAAAR